MIKKHVYFDGLLKPEILDKLKILKGGTFDGPYAEGATINFTPSLKSRFGQNVQDIVLYGKSIFPITCQQGNETIVKYLSFDSHHEEKGTECKTFYVDLLDELPANLAKGPERMKFDWHNDPTQVRTIANIQFYGTNQDLKFINNYNNTVFTFRQETIEFIVFNFVNHPKIFLINNWIGSAEIYFDLDDISIAEFIDKQGCEKGHDEDEIENRKIVLQHEI